MIGFLDKCYLIRDIERSVLIFVLLFMSFLFLQRLLRMLDGLNFKEFVAFLSAFSSRATLQQKVECNYSFYYTSPYDNIVTSYLCHFYLLILQSFIFLVMLFH